VLTTIKTKLIKLALKKAMSSVCPHSIPRSGEEGATIKCYSTRVFFTSEEQLLAESINSSGITGKWIYPPDDHFKINASIPFDFIKPQNLKIRRYFGYYEMEYEGLWDFLINDLSGKEVLKAQSHKLWNYIVQFFFNRKPLEQKKRQEILRILVNEDISKRGFEFTPFSIMSYFYTLRWFRHPSAEEERRRLTLYFESFVESGELSKTHLGNYKVTPSAIVTLEKYDIDERRHKDNISLQNKVLIATIILVFLAFVQAGLIKIPAIIDLGDSWSKLLK